MKVSREQVAEHRRRIVGAAGKLFREKGFDGVGVADIMKSAGLTHGGFYGHFASREERHNSRGVYRKQENRTNQDLATYQFQGEACLFKPSGRIFGSAFAF